MDSTFVSHVTNVYTNLKQYETTKLGSTKIPYARAAYKFIKL